MMYKGYQLIIPILFLIIIAPVGRSGFADHEVTILTRPQKISESVGFNVTLPCAIKNLGTSVVTWYKGDQVLTAKDFIVLQDARLRVDLTDQGVANLSILDLKRSDEGEYTCAVNTKDQVLKLNHHLNINLAPSIQAMHPRDIVTVKVGSLVTLRCGATGHPKPQIYWRRKHNLSFPFAPSQHVIQGASLTLESIGKDYGGEYICVADNGIGIPAQSTIMLNVLYGPSIVLEETYHHVKLGQTVTLTCKIFANPPPKVTWYKNTMKLMDGQRIVTKQVGNSYKLTIENVSEEDFSAYSCKASNPLKQDVKQQFKISGCPPPPIILSEEYSSTKYSYELTWKVESYYQIIQHQINIYLVEQTNTTEQKEILSEVKKVKASGDSRSYNFKGLISNQTYKVEVRSRNNHGWGPFSQQFTVHMFQRDKQPMEIKDSQPIFKKNAPLLSDKTSGSGSDISSQLNYILKILFTVILIYTQILQS